MLGGSHLSSSDPCLAIEIVPLGAEKVEDALRKAGLIPRRAPTSFLLKVALAAFDEKSVDDLKSIVEEVKAQDGRGKWMHTLKA